MRAILVAAVALSGCVIYVPGEIAPGNGIHTTELRSVPAFSSVVNSTPVRTQISEGAQQQVFLTIDSNLQDALSFDVREGELTIDLIGVSGIRPTSQPLIDILVPDLRSARTQGSASLDIEGFRGAVDRTVIAYGSGSVTYSGGSAVLEAQTFGSGSMTLRGTAQTLQATTYGSGNIMALGLTATSVDATTYGSGNITANANGGTVRVHILGSGNVDCWGYAQLTDLNDVGSGNFTGHWDMEY